MVSLVHCRGCYFGLAPFVCCQEAWGCLGMDLLHLGKRLVSEGAHRGGLQKLVDLVVPRSQGVHGGIPQFFVWIRGRLSHDDVVDAPPRQELDDGFVVLQRFPREFGVNPGRRFRLAVSIASRGFDLHILVVQIRIELSQELAVENVLKTIIGIAGKMGDLLLLFIENVYEDLVVAQLGKLDSFLQ